MDEWLLQNLVCPHDRQRSDDERHDARLRRRPSISIVDDIPVMIFPDERPTHDYLRQSLEKVERIRNGEASGRRSEKRRHSKRSRWICAGRTAIYERQSISLGPERVDAVILCRIFDFRSPTEKASGCRLQLGKVDNSSGAEGIPARRALIQVSTP